MQSVLEVRCSSCKVSGTCPRRGSSPLTLSGGKKQVLCRIVGGYSRTPLDESAMSEESRERSAADGPCLTLAEVPVRDEASGLVSFEVTKIFHHPILHPREKTDVQVDIMLKTH